MGKLVLAFVLGVLVRTMSFEPSSSHGDSAQTRAASGRTRRGIDLDLAPEDRYCMAYDPVTGRHLTDADLDDYMERLSRPWWKFW